MQPNTQTTTLNPQLYSAGLKSHNPWPRYLIPLVSEREASSRAQFWSLAARRSCFKAHNLAIHSKLNIRQIERRCREELGRAPQEWLNEQKLVAARWLLIETESVKKVALELGFKQLSHFCREFKQAYGMTPSQYLTSRQRFDENVAIR